MALGHSRQALTFLSGTSYSTAVFIAHDHVSLECPTFSGLGAATASVSLLGAATSDGTFYDIREEGSYSAGVGILKWEVPDSTGAWLAECTPASRHSWIKVQLSTAATGGYTMYIHQHNAAK